MTLNEYNNLSTHQRLDIAWEWAYFISKNTIGNKMTINFFMDGFVVEIRMSIFDNQIEFVQGISKEEFEKRFAVSKKAGHFFGRSLQVTV